MSSIFDGSTFYIVPDKLNQTEILNLKILIENNGGRVMDVYNDCSLIISAVKSPIRLEKFVPSNCQIPIISTQWIHECIKQKDKILYDPYVIDFNKFLANFSKNSTLFRPSEAESPIQVLPLPSSQSINVHPQCSPFKSKRRRTDSGSDEDLSSGSQNLLDPDFNNCSYECQRNTPLDCPNDDLVQELSVIKRGRQCEGNERSFMSYARAIACIKAYTRKIQSGREASQIQNVGPKVGRMVDDFIRQGYIAEAEIYRRDEKFQVQDKFMNIFGVGSKIALQWYNQGLRSFEDVKNLPNLSSNQQKWLEHLDDLSNPITRDEAQDIISIVSNIVKSVSDKVKVEATGGYRRGKLLSNDLDILISTSNTSEFSTSNLLQKVLDKLRQNNYLVHILIYKSNSGKDVSQNHKNQSTMDNFNKAFVLFRDTKPNSKVRQVDLIVVEPSQWATAMLGWTGSQQFERSIRRFAKDHGFHLNSHGLFNEDGKLIKTDYEQEVFEKLGLPYIEPQFRNC